MKRLVPLHNALVGILSREEVFQTNMMKVEKLTETHEMFNGEKSKPFAWDLVRKNHAAAVLIHNVPTDEVLLVEQFRPAMLFTLSSSERVPFNTTGHTLEIVAGGLGKHSPEMCVRSEAMQEAGIDLGEVILLPSFFPSIGVCDEHIFMFYAPIYSKDPVPGIGGGLKEENEDTKTHWVKYRKLLKMIRSGEITDGKTQNGIYAIQRIRRKNLK